MYFSKSILKRKDYMKSTTERIKLFITTLDDNRSDLEILSLSSLDFLISGKHFSKNSLILASLALYYIKYIQNVKKTFHGVICKTILPYIKIRQKTFRIIDISIKIQCFFDTYKYMKHLEALLCCRFAV